MLQVNIFAPEFQLPDESGKIHSLSDYRGKYVLVYFYPKDDTPGCTKEACALRDVHEQYLKSSIIVLGVSTDSSSSHEQFKEKFQLPFTLLSDADGKMISMYGAQGSQGTDRISYLINPEGRIVKVYEKVIPEHHAGEVMDEVQKQIHTSLHS